MISIDNDNEPELKQNSESEVLIVYEEEEETDIQEEMPEMPEELWRNLYKEVLLRPEVFTYSSGIIALDDLNQDGIPELYIASGSTPNYWLDGVYDASTGKLEENAETGVPYGVTHYVNGQSGDLAIMGTWGGSDMYFDYFIQWGEEPLQLEYLPIGGFVRGDWDAAGLEREVVYYSGLPLAPATPYESEENLQVISEYSFEQALQQTSYKKADHHQYDALYFFDEIPTEIEINAFLGMESLEPITDSEILTDLTLKARQMEWYFLSLKDKLNYNFFEISDIHDNIERWLHSAGEDPVLAEIYDPEGYVVLDGEWLGRPSEEMERIFYESFGVELEPSLVPSSSANTTYAFYKDDMYYTLLAGYPGSVLYDEMTVEQAYWIDDNTIYATLSTTTFEVETAMGRKQGHLIARIYEKDGMKHTYLLELNKNSGGMPLDDILQW